MSWRTIVITRRAKLELKLNSMVVREEDQITKIYLGEMYMLIIENTAVSVTVSLLSELMKRKIKVIFCDEKRNPSSEMLPYVGSHDSSAKIREQIAWQKEMVELVWTEIVTEKIRKQAELLMHYGKEEAGLLIDYAKEVKLMDTTNREGHGAKVYFNALFGKAFTRTADHPINAALNYGYGILLSAFNREIVANGYLTQIGLFHNNQFNPFNLASDLMEPFRPLVDAKVIEDPPNTFGKEEKHQLLTFLNQEVTINGKKQVVTNAIKIYCRSIFEAINQKDLAEIRFYRNELSIYENHYHV